MACEYQPHEDSGIHPDPGDFAFALHEHLADGLGDQADDYLVEAATELLAIAPGVRQAIISKLDTETVESVFQMYGDAPGHMFASVLQDVREREQERE